MISAARLALSAAGVDEDDIRRKSLQAINDRKCVYGADD
jgi:hypothetical protein